MVGPFFNFSQAQAALVYDAVTLVADTFNRMLKKKPDTFRSYLQRNKGESLANASRALNCSRNAVWEQGDRIAKFARKVSWETILCCPVCMYTTWMTQLNV